MNGIDLKGRCAVVTGAAQGLGYAIAERIVQSGAAICVWDIKPDRLDEAVAKLKEHAADNTTVFGQEVDISSEGGVNRALDNSIDALSKIDIIVNNAGISGPNKVTWEYPVDDWQKVVDINLTGTFLVSRAVVPGMLERNYGRIVNIASVAGKEGNPNAPAYSATKAGIIALTKTLGKELAQTKITVNCVTPAAVRTQIFDQMTEEHVEFMLSKIPMGRFGEPAEIAALVAWLCSEECSFSTGGVFDISGGRATY